MGMALHPDLLKSRGRDWVYLVSTYDADAGSGVTRRLRVRRYTYDAAAQTLGSPLTVHRQPAGPRRPRRRPHPGRARRQAVAVARRPGRQLARQLLQRHPFAGPARPPAQVAARDWFTYQGKILRLELDGAIPADNPTINGVRSHIYSYGYRNPQGLVVRADGPALRVRARPEHRRRDRPHPGRQELRLAARGRLQRRPQLRLRQLVGVDDAVRDAEVQQPHAAAVGAAEPRSRRGASRLRAAADHPLHGAGRLRPRRRSAARRSGRAASTSTTRRRFPAGGSRCSSPGCAPAPSTA